MVSTTVCPPPDARQPLTQLVGDECLAHELRQHFARQTYPGLRRIEIDVVQGVARLEGRVSSFFIKQVAQHTASTVAGIDRIDNQLEVDDRRQRG